MQDARLTYLEYKQQRAAKESEWDRRRRVQTAIDRAAVAEERGRYEQFTVLLEDVLVPGLVGSDGREIRRYHNKLDAVDWDPSPLVEFVNGHRDPATLRGAFQELVTIAQCEDIIEGELKPKATATGFAIKLGEHHQDWEMDFGDPVRAVTSEKGALKSFYTGGTGSGKSAGASRQMEDYYRASLSDDHREYKLLDPVGLSAENVAAYDLPQWQDALREARVDHGLPEDWRDVDGLQPEMELYVPLTPDLRDFKLPYDTDAEEFVATPFTIPAADLSEGLLVSLIDARVSDGQERLIREAYRSVANDADDWSLDDLSYSIRNRDDLSEKDTAGATTVLGNLKSSGVIRTRGHEHAIDWEELFYSTDVVTVFNQMPLKSDLMRLVVVAHLLDQVYDLRIQRGGHPMLAMWLRELWEIAPHGLIRGKGDDAEKRIKEHIIHTLLKIMRKPRDISTSIVADTQDASDPEKAIRTRFNRFVLFGGNDKTLKDVFSWANQNGWQSFKRTLTGKAGHAGVIAGCDPAVSSPKRWGVSPVHLTPPSWHHHDKDETKSGWQVRVDITAACDELPTEDRRYVSGHWDISAPEHEELVVTDASETEEESMMSTKERAKLKARQYRSFTTLSYADIADEIPNNPDTDKPFDRTTIMEWTRGVEKGSGEIVTGD